MCELHSLLKMKRTNEGFLRGAVEEASFLNPRVVFL